MEVGQGAHFMEHMGVEKGNAGKWGGFVGIITQTFS